MNRHIFITFVALLVAGCATARTITTRTPLYKYRADVQITAAGKSINGMISIPRTDPVTIQVDSPVRMDLVRISSCNRDKTLENVGQKTSWFGWSESGKQLTFDFSPNEVEREGFCPVYIQIFDKDLLTAWGLVAFRTDEKMKATVSCNGLDYGATGLDACQSMQGFEQGLRFEKPIKFVPKGPCDVKRIDDKTLRVRTTAPGFCTVTAFDGADYFVFILLGYDEILVRGSANPIKTGFSGGGG